MTKRDDNVAALVPSSAEPVILKNRAQQLKKQDNPVLHWIITWNNYHKDDLDDFYKDSAKICEKFNFQEEVGKSGTPHIQGYFKLLKKSRLSTMKELCDLAHWEPCKNPKACENYCKKEGWDGLAENGKRFIFPPPVDVLPDDLMKPWMHEILESIQNKADYRTINWIYDPIGNNMKTAFVKKCAYELNTIFITGGKGSDILHMVAENISGKQVINWSLMIDYPRTLEGKVSYTAIESIKNGIWTSPKYEGKSVIVNCPHMWIFANWLPDLNSMSEDRWKIWELKESRLAASTPREG
nr:MAG: replication associated protein [Cressdnaviricota sp.]